MMCACGHREAIHLDGICMAEACLCVNFNATPEPPQGQSNVAFLALMAKADAMVRRQEQLRVALLEGMADSRKDQG